MQNTIGMATADAGNDLSQKGAHRRQRQALPFANVVRRLVLIHECFEIVRDEFKDQIQSARVGLNNVQ
jgi:hypothetical protein